MKKNERLKGWRKKIFWLAWITYASFYFTRVNISIAIPGIIEEFEISKTEIGGILTIFSLSYAWGNGRCGCYIKYVYHINKGERIKCLIG